LHGDSAGFDPPHTVAASAADVNALTLHLASGENVIVGHSFGGKVALAAARSAGTGMRQVWVLDSTPESGRTAAGADRLLALLSRLPSRFEDRRAAVSLIEAEGFSPVIAGWAATNLVPRDGAYVWRLDLPSLDLMLADFYREDLWPVVENPPDRVQLIFVRARHGSIMSVETAERVGRLEADGERVRLVELDGGHWLNMSNPAGVLQLLAHELPR
jgi:pimeloyl-ACP methyl ester carboxylesterase